MPRPAPRRLAPPPYEQGNIPALAAAFLGPLSILLTFLSPGGFFIALPCGIAAIALGTVGVRTADPNPVGRPHGRPQPGRPPHPRPSRPLHRVPRSILALIAVIVFGVVNAAQGL